MAQRIAELVQASPSRNTGLSSPKGAKIETSTPRPTEAANRDRLVDHRSIDDCEQELTCLIGPIAKFIVATKRNLENQVSLTTFVETLSAEIPDPRKADQFRQRMLRK
ncbi:MAG: hypothetical protein C4287_14380 [Leptolyngbya sp. ERB_1_2]